MKWRRQLSNAMNDAAEIVGCSGICADLDMSPALLETKEDPSKQPATAIQWSVVSRDEKVYVRDFSALIYVTATNGQRKQLEELTANLTAVGCDTSVFMLKLYNVTNSIFLANALRAVLRQKDGFKRCKIPGNAARTVVHAPV